MANGVRPVRASDSLTEAQRQRGLIFCMDVEIIESVTAIAEGMRVQDIRPPPLRCVGQLGGLVAWVPGGLVGTTTERIVLNIFLLPPLRYTVPVLTDRLDDKRPFNLTGTIDVDGHSFDMLIVEDGGGSGHKTTREFDRKPDTMLGTGTQLPTELMRLGDRFRAAPEVRRPPAAAASLMLLPAPGLPATATRVLLLPAPGPPAAATRVLPLPAPGLPATATRVLPLPTPGQLAASARPLQLPAAGLPTAAAAGRGGLGLQPQHRPLPSLDWLAAATAAAAAAAVATFKQSSAAAAAAAVVPSGAARPNGGSSTPPPVHVAGAGQGRKGRGCGARPSRSRARAGEKLPATAVLAAAHQGHPSAASVPAVARFVAPAVTLPSEPGGRKRPAMAAASSPVADGEDTPKSSAIWRSSRRRG